MQDTSNIAEVLRRADDPVRDHIRQVKPEEAPRDGTELSSLSMFMRNTGERTLFTFIELEGYPILRITISGKTEDLILNNDQVKLLLRQMTLWLTR